jgi:hypothetical protein
MLKAPDLFKLRGPTIRAKLLLKRVCPIISAITLPAELCNPVICSIMRWSRSQSTLGLLPVLLHLWVWSMNGASHLIVNIK